MIDISLFTNSNFGLKALDFSDHDIIEWNKVLKELNAKGLKVVEFDAKLDWYSRWLLIIEPQGRDEDLGSIVAPDFYKILNESLKRGFTTSEGSTSEYWANIFSDIDISGFNIPVNDLRKVDVSSMHFHLDYYRLHIKYFPYQDLFATIQRETKDTGEVKYSGAQVIWCYIYYYSIFLHRLKSDDKKSYKLYGKWYSEYFDQENYYRRLPSEQISIFLLNYCEALIFNPTNRRIDSRSFMKGMRSVRFFIEEFGNELDTLLVESEKELMANVGADSFVNILNAVVNIFSKDKDEVLLQETLDNKSLLYLHDALPLLLQMKYGPNSIYNVTGIIKDRIFESDNRAAGQFKEDIDSLPQLAPTKHRIYVDDVQYWYDITLAERERLVDLIRTNTSEDLTYKSLEATQSRCRNHWVNLINKISAPILIWEHENGVVLPRFNLFEDGKVISLSDEYKHNEQQVIVEKKLLNLHLKEMSKIEYRYDLEAYLKANNPLFTYGTFRYYWEEELKRVTLIIQQKELFYTSRMKELGIFESKMSLYEKNICLREMIQIEKEIRPYIQFVKKAFQTALPIRKTVRFSSNRHASDGVEFDPDTLFDQEKWIRANVMKVMESSVELGDAVQINTFCLDFSGSMTHNRMRNLFKTLYLLVVGLEDRKSFDAFHFFSNNFIEVVNFSNEFTTKKVLFKILRQISEVESDEVVYGGYGATNMSKGMGISLDKMKEFTQEFKVANPIVNLVSSMFVISDGEPNIGVTDPELLRKFVEEKRKDEDVEIKGIFIKSEEDIDSNFMKQIFGDDNCIEAEDFQEGVDRFIRIMTKTYKKQRKTYKWKQKKQKLGLSQ